MNRRWVAAYAAASLVGFIGTTVSKVDAHTPSDHYTHLWAPANGAISYSFTTGFPAGAYRDRVRDGVALWSARGERAYFTNTAFDVANFNPRAECPTSSPARPNAIHWDSVPGTDVGEALTCYVPPTYQDMSSASMIIDSDEAGNWYTGTGNPGSMLDLWSAAVHESGHMAGHLVHFTSPCPGQVMCARYPSGAAGRTLYTHDAHTFDNAYAPTWFLSNNFSGTTSVAAYEYGIEGDFPLSCDSDGDGDSTSVVFRAGTFYIRNTNDSGSSTTAVTLSGAGNFPVCGDWDGDGDETVGTFNQGTGEWRLDNNNDGSVDYTCTYGAAGDVPVVGNWDGLAGTNYDTIGVVRGNTWMLANTVIGTQPVGWFNYGNSSGDWFVAGNWNGTTTERTTTPGVYRASTGKWYLNDGFDSSHDYWVSNPADGIPYGGGPGDVPIVGNFDGSGSNKSDTIGLVRGQ